MDKMRDRMGYNSCKKTHVKTVHQTVVIEVRTVGSHTPRVLCARKAITRAIIS